MVSSKLLEMAKGLEKYVTPVLATETKFGLFLEYLMESGNVADAAREADLTIQQIRRFRRNHPEAQTAFEEALDIGTDAIEAEVHRRAVVGIMEPVFYKGRRVNTVRKKSDILLMFLLKQRRPSYRDNAPIPISDETPEHELESPAEVIARRLASIAERKRETRDPRVIDHVPTKKSRA